MATLPKGQGVIPLPPFKAWLASNIPAVYDNTMTYYEELCALLKYLQDQVVPALNENASAITVLSNYVENYFTNLDVQEEINNKLDEMAEDGTLQEIISSYIQANVTWTFDTVADMKASTNLVAGSYARTLGFHTINDGGGALYKITDTGTANEMDVIAVDDLFANVILPITITPAMLGAYGDNTHNDTTVLQRCITLSHDINLDNKTYSVNDTLLIDKSNFNLHDGAINYIKNSDILIQLDGDISNVKITTIKFTGVATADTVIQCIGNPSKVTNNFTNITISNNEISEFNVAISINANLGGDFSNISIENNKIFNIYGASSGVGYGIHVANENDTYANVTIANNDVSYCTRHCIYIARGNGYNLIDNYIHDNSTAITSIRPAINIIRSKNVYVKGNRISRCNNVAMFLASELELEEDHALESYPCENVIIDDNIFEGSQNSTGILVGFEDVTKAFCYNIKITNNTFNNADTIQVYGVKNILIENNKMNKTSGACLVLHGGSNQTSSVYLDEVYIKNNTFITGDNARVIRLQNHFVSQPSNVTFENNLTNSDHTFYLQSVITSNNILLVNQNNASDFSFGSGGAFKPYTINGVDVTA